MGKSKLAIELAKRFGGEVINADSMQVYDALPIATNRVTEVEADGVPHHLLGFLAPTEVYHAGRFLEDVLPVLDDIWARGKLAIVVGGTHYYIEALIFKTLIGTADPKQLQTAADAAAGTAQGTAHGTGAETTAAPVDGVIAAGEIPVRATGAPSGRETIERPTAPPRVWPYDAERMSPTMAPSR